MLGCECNARFGGLAFGAKRHQAGHGRRAVADLLAIGLRLTLAAALLYEASSHTSGPLSTAQASHNRGSRRAAEARASCAPGAGRELDALRFGARLQPIDHCAGTIPVCPGGLLRGRAREHAAHQNLIARLHRAHDCRPHARYLPVLGMLRRVQPLTHLTSNRASLPPTHQAREPLRTTVGPSSSTLALPTTSSSSEHGDLGRTRPPRRGGRSAPVCPPRLQPPRDAIVGPHAARVLRRTHDPAQRLLAARGAEGGHALTEPSPGRAAQRRASE